VLLMNAPRAQQPSSDAPTVDVTGPYIGTHITRGEPGSWEYLDPVHGPAGLPLPTSVLSLPVCPTHGESPYQACRSAVSHAGTGLTIVATSAPNITSDANGAATQSTINTAVAAYKNLFSDSVTVNI